MTEQSVICTTIATEADTFIGHIRLNKPAALNAIDLSMVRRIDAQLLEWEGNEDIVCIVLDGIGDKAFCAGGDVVSMYNAMRQEPGKTPQFLQDFFNLEYQLDYRIHTYDKPIIVVGNGIVMGGGLGLFNGASHRVVTATSRIAMPEITIGLYPDVGGSWFLQKMRDNLGLFLGLTGASMNAVDALYVELADYYLGVYTSEDLIDALKRQPWPSERSTINAVREMHQVVNIVLKTFDGLSKDRPSAQIEPAVNIIAQACNATDVETVANNILALDSTDNKWLARAQKGLANGSPITAHIVFEQMRRAQSLSLADCFRMELDLSCRCGEFGEFAEGVRALLIDKDMQPQWRFNSISAVPQETIEWFFTSPWTTEEHPLALLGQSL
ncbi:enoyl-CoA hydratase/isomerase family protein [Alteromonas sp. ASW11-36]|uniref:3-hydroxyisobutyryl-CoA hydrolase n=1 Tax=Alteromonas arenosi TaxID=3055817 RepID=A0ABT7SXV3_9ALTE|nr:enoyl-CoA hydratase/isomerase family protein [Alteromonas sp. ASW11-36]MDM7861025.1 enoyl-CoA hydratase/isomerase family protein [Alteromonas sp. ASW11-36]